MPWLRRYRLNDGPVYDGIEVEDTGPDESSEGKLTSNARGLVAMKDQELARLRAYVKKLEEQVGNIEDDASYSC